METIRCKIERVRYQNTENGYSVFQVSDTDENDWYNIVGTFSGVGIGASLSCDGEWTQSKYGRQFTVSSWREEMPTTIAGMESYLSSGMISGIGPVMARRIVKLFGMDTYRIIDEDIEKLSQVQGISRKRIEKIKLSWNIHKGVKDVMTFLQGYGVSPTYAIRIYKEYGDESIKRVRENPYALADDIFGIGFKIADKIAFSFGYKKDDIRRCKAGVIFILGQMAMDGHCFAERGQMIGKSVELLEVGEESVTEALNRLVLEQGVINEDDNYFLPMYYSSECKVSNIVKSLLANGDVSEISVDIEEISKENNIEYDDLQIDAIRQSLRSKVMVLTGGPGTGKSTVVKGIIAAFKDKNILLAAPTGRAAKRMSEATGIEAMTIHRLLNYNPNDGFGYNEDNPLHGDLLVVDESSMIDIVLMSSLMKAVPDKMRVILVGDIDQLPSVGAGNVLRDIIDSGVVPVVRLTKIFRQAMTSRIVTNAHMVNKGLMPDISNGKDSDFFFIRQGDAEQAAKDIVDIVRNRIPKAYGYDTSDIQVLAPMKNGVVGTISLNIALQDAINPVGEFIQSWQFKYRKGDRVMQIKNNYDKNVFNGDVGIVLSVNSEDRQLTVLYDKEPVEYESGDLNELTLAYACTIHKSQGSEYPVVVMPLMMSHYIMLQRNLVYTGITRAKKLCIVIGDTKAMAMAVRNQVVTERNTKLKERLNDK